MTAELLVVISIQIVFLYLYWYLGKKPKRTKPDLQPRDMNKDLDNPQPTLSDLANRDPFAGISLRQMTPEEIKERLDKIEADTILVKRLRTEQREMKEQDQFVMELGDDVLKGYTPDERT